MNKATIDLQVMLYEPKESLSFRLTGMLEQLKISTIHRVTDLDEALQKISQYHFDVFLLSIDQDDQSGGVWLGRIIRRQRLNSLIIYLSTTYTEECYSQIRASKPSSFLAKNLSLLELRQAIELGIMLA